MSQRVTLSTASVPSDWCFSSIREWWPNLIGLLEAFLTGNVSTFNRGNTTPAPDDQDKPWVRSNADGSPDRLYEYSNGAWLAKHPVAAGTVIMWEGAEADIPTFDGGEAGTVTATTGPMWEKVTSMNAKFPIGPGTLPSGDVVAIGGTGGEEKHTITQPELPNVTINTKSMLRTNVEDGGDATVFIPQGSTGNPFANTPMVTESLNGGVTQVAGNNLPPYQAIWFLRKSARTHYRL